VAVGITRAHLEEDTARLLHRVEPGGRAISLLDFDRSGAPLMEIVTDPVIRTAEVARRYAEELRLLLVTIGASDAAMESGQMRVEANVSLRPVGETAFGTRVEVKNMNSFRSVERAIDHEIERQTRALRDGTPLVQETRGWDEERGLTYRMRLKETSDDYRYFPEPDLPPLRVDPAWLDEIREGLPELPADRRARYRDALGLTAYDAAVLVADADATALFESALASESTLPAKRLANWVTGEYLRLVKGEGGAAAAGRVTGAELAALVRLIEDGQLSGTNAKEVFARLAETGQPVHAIVAEAGLHQIRDEGALMAAVRAAVDANPAAVADVRSGKEQAIGFLVGAVMKATRGQADAATVKHLVRAAIDEAGPG
jgi:aspartyl-tRNA(Asn)/glutamyl-tRNA(Gln) amidotransferase subunit B